MAETSYVGDLLLFHRYHRFCSISKHKSPLAYTLGWNILLMNFTCGACVSSHNLKSVATACVNNSPALVGYDSSNCKMSLNVCHYKFSTPSSKGVSCGPNITAFQSKTLSGQGLPLTPSGASSFSRLKSLISRFLAGVDIAGLVKRTRRLDFDWSGTSSQIKT
jgi:hypothetical protein